MESEEEGQFPEAPIEEVTGPADETGDGVPELSGLTLSEPPMPPSFEENPQDQEEFGYLDEPMAW